MILTITIMANDYNKCILIKILIITVMNGNNAFQLMMS